MNWILFLQIVLAVLAAGWFYNVGAQTEAGCSRLQVVYSALLGSAALAVVVAL